MTAQEFVQYMPANALADTIKSAWESGSEDDADIQVIRICWEALVSNVGEEAAKFNVGIALGYEVDDLMEVVS